MVGRITAPSVLRAALVRARCTGGTAVGGSTGAVGGDDSLEKLSGVVSRDRRGDGGGEGGGGKSQEGKPGLHNYCIGGGGDIIILLRFE